MSEITVDGLKKLNMDELNSKLSDLGLSVIEKINRSNSRNTF